jgi:hypothetical protein
LSARAQRIHHVRQRQRQHGQRTEHDERLDAAAHEHAFEHLQGEQRRNEQRKIQNQARRPGEQDERPKLTGEQPIHS